MIRAPKPVLSRFFIWMLDRQSAESTASVYVSLVRRIINDVGGDPPVFTEENLRCALDCHDVTRQSQYRQAWNAYRRFCEDFGTILPEIPRRNRHGGKLIVPPPSPDLPLHIIRTMRWNRKVTAESLHIAVWRGWTPIDPQHKLRRLQLPGMGTVWGIVGCPLQYCDELLAWSYPDTPWEDISPEAPVFPAHPGDQTSRYPLPRFRAQFALTPRPEIG